ncbi:MAG: glycosyltransferase [Candidatus Eremiobacteraeota bacterium]|nr:glycosyltransferase [Candidatus Eremiobacteraeota bacterium]
MPVRVTSRRNAPPPAPKAVKGESFGLPKPPPNWRQLPAGISLCMIVKNEERFLEQCLRSVSGMVDEINIVDTGSTDRTIEIAQSFGARIEQRDWRNDFAWARNEAIAMATRRWILMLDADEELLPDSRSSLITLKNTPGYLTGLWLRCQNKADDYAGTGEMSHLLIRIFPNNEKIRYRGTIHEFPATIDSPTGIGAVPSGVRILHHGYLKEVVAARNKGARNLEIVQAATDANPSDPFNWFNLGTTAFLIGDNALAISALEKMIEINGDKPRGFMANGLTTLADAYDRQKMFSRSLEVAELCLTYSPHFANAHFSIGKALFGLGRIEEARDAYKAAIEDRKHSHEQFVVDDEVSIWKAQTEIGNTYVFAGDDETAIEWFDKGIANRPSAAPIRINRARALERLKRFTESEAAYKSLYEEFGDQNSILDYVNFLLRRHFDLQAVAVIESSYSKLSPRVGVSTLVIGAMVGQRQGWVDAERYLELAVGLLPGCAEALTPLEAIYRQRGDEAALALLLENESRTEPQEPADFLRRSYAAIAKQDYTDALAFANGGIAIAPNDPLLRYNAAVAAVNLKSQPEALVHLDAIQTSDAIWAQAEYLRAVVLRDLERLDESLAALERLLTVDAAQVDAILLRAAVLEALHRQPEAERSLLEAMPLAKQRIAVELAGLYLRQGRLADAQSFAEQILSDQACA